LFREALGIAPDVLTDRLATLLARGVMAREPYQEAGSRSRFAFVLTPTGRELSVVLGRRAFGDGGTSGAAGRRRARRLSRRARRYYVARRA
jgi:DNA-binding HxlR family transcriptional regulator